MSCAISSDISCGVAGIETVFQPHCQDVGGGVACDY
jgi:hypothetical protein